MAVCLKGISEECFLFNVNVNTSLKFLWALGGLSEGTEALGHLKGAWSKSRGHSKGTRTLGHLRYSDTPALRALEHLDTREIRELWHLGTQALRGNLQTWKLAPDIWQQPAKNRVMSDEGCFITDTVAWREVKKNIISNQRLKA